MNKLTRVLLLPLMIAGGAVTVLACAGGGGGDEIGPKNHEFRRFAGSYTGSTSGTVAPGHANAGKTIPDATLSFSINGHGHIDGTLTSPEFGEAPLTGTASSDGKLDVTVTIREGAICTLQGSVGSFLGGYKAAGVFATTQAGKKLDSGQFLATRA